MSASLVIGLDIGASKMLAGLATRSGDVKRRLQSPTPGSPDGILLEARSLCERLIDLAGAPVLAIGVGSAGIVNSRTGRVIHANDNLPGWSGSNLTQLSVQSLPVVAENDARAFAYGEATLGAGAAFQSLLGITVGTGIGGAIIIDGQIWHGAQYSAGEVGYLVVDWHGGQPIILDQYASGPGIERAYQAAAGHQERLPLTEISRRARAGEELAGDIISQKARRLGHILAGYVTSLNPEAVILGGGVAQIGEIWQRPLEAAFRQSLPSLLSETPLLRASLGVDAVMLGAAQLAWQEAAA